MIAGDFITCIKDLKDSLGLPYCNKGDLLIITNRHELKLLSIRPFNNRVVWITNETLFSHFVPSNMTKLDRIIFGVKRENIKRISK